MLLNGKVAVIYGGGGAIGSAVARTFASEGARVFLAGRTAAKLDAVAGEIRACGGTVETALVDALDEQAVGQFVDTVAESAGQIDISFNLISYHDVQTPLLDITLEDYLQPIMNGARTQFLTSVAAARHMKQRGSGVILQFGGGGPQTMHGMGGFKVSLDTLESFRRQLALELGEFGIRVVTLKTGGIPETLTEDDADGEQIATAIEQATLLKRAATFDDVGNVAAFVASDRAKTITGTEVNISCGAIID